MSVRSVAGSLWMDPANYLLECSRLVHLLSLDKNENSHTFAAESELPRKFRPLCGLDKA